MEEGEKELPREEADEEFGEARAAGDGMFDEAAGEDDPVGTKARVGQGRG